MHGLRVSGLPVRLLCLLLVTSALLIQSGDVELNPGPAIEDVLREILAFREENQRQFQGLRSEMGALRKDVENIVGEVEAIKETVNVQSLDIAALATEAEAVQDKLEKMGDEIERMERYSRRENLVFHGVQEEEGERNSEVKPKVAALLNEVIKDQKKWCESDFVRAHRLGTRGEGKTRPLIVRLQQHDDIFTILAAREALKDQGVGVANDLTRYQRSELKSLRLKGKKGYYKGGELHVEDFPSLPGRRSDSGNGTPWRTDGQRSGNDSQRGTSSSDSATSSWHTGRRGSPRGASRAGHRGHRGDGRGGATFIGRGSWGRRGDSSSER